MAKKREQYLVGLVYNREMVWHGNQLVFHERDFDNSEKKSCKVLVSECRVFRKECKDMWEDKVRLARDEFGRLRRDENGLVELEVTKVRSARNFVVVDFKKCKSKMKIKKALRHGFYMIHPDGTKTLFRRVSRSAAKSRTGKALFTSKNPHEVRYRCSYGAQFEEYEVISKMEARFGLIESSSMEMDEPITFDVLPDYTITRKHDVEMYDPDTQELVFVKDFEKDYNPLDGQGTVLPARAVQWAHELYIISNAERDYLLEQLTVNPDPRVLVGVNPKFAKLWDKIPQFWLVRFGFAKGGLVVFPHNLPEYRQDCNGETVRRSGKVMKFWNEDEHVYNFDADVLFTDSMWKANFDRKFTTNEVNVYDEFGNLVEDNRVKMEIVLWSKPRANGRIYMGYQYWQALNSAIANPIEYAKMRIDEVRDTIFVNADHAKAFLGCLDTTYDADDYEDNMTKAGGRIQKILEMLNENPELIRDPYIQKSLREMRERYIRDMGTGRIAVPGANPFIITDPVLMFGKRSLLGPGDYYYNGTEKKYAGFRSPLIHRSEAVVLNTVDVEQFRGLFKDVLVMNPYDDTLPRMGGADTDGDRIAIVDDETIVKAVYTGLPMLYDKGGDGEKKKVCDESIYEFDYATIVSDAPTIGEVTDMSTSWKDLAEQLHLEHIREIVGDLTEGDIDTIVKILRFMQGWAIDYAKTGYFPPVPDVVKIAVSPSWHPWSKKAYEAGNEDAKPFTSYSRIGKLHAAIEKYLATKYYKSVESSITTRDFSFEFASAADYEEVERIKPMVATLERAYRKDFERMNELDLDEDQQREYVNHIVDKYQRAVLSIDSDIASIAAAAYQHAYFDNGSKGKAISFPWVVCYEGLLLNASKSSDNKTKLRLARYDGHIDNVPETLKFYQCKSSGDGYTVWCKVPNGTYETFRKNGNLYVKVKSRSISTLKKIDRLIPENKHIPFDFYGFKANGFSAAEVLAALRAEDGIITVRKQHDGDEVRAAVYIGEQRMGSVARQHKALLAPYLPCELKVMNVDKLSAVVKRKDQPAKEASFFALDCQFIRALDEAEEKPKRKRERINADEYMSYDEAYRAPRKQQEEPIDIEAPGIPKFKVEIMNRLNRNADYWSVKADPSKYGIVGVTVEQTDKVAVGNVCAKVTLINKRGESKSFEVCAVEGKQFALHNNEKMPAEMQAFILQMAHYELCRIHVERIRAAQ